MVLKLSDPTSLVEGLSESWQALCGERLEITNANGITFMDQDTIRSIMEVLADLSNLCYLHYLKLALYQGGLDAEPEPVKDEGFRATL